jgi:glutathione synthase/RimK-type ligase-like ATP-grasp enzyme
MIIFYGRGDDTPLARAVEAAADLGVEHLVVDQRRAADADLWVEVGSGGVQGRLVVAGAEVDLAAVQGIYARPLELPAAAGDPLDARRARVFASGFLEWLDLAPGRVVNPPATMHSNASKPYQAQLVARAGFPVPATLVTDDPEEVLAFRREHPRVVYKSISGVRSIVRELDDTAARRLDRIRALPTQFQAYVPGIDVRVHVVGDRVFATEVASQALDYRYAGRDGLTARLAAHDLPDGVAERCLALAAALGLRLCGIDLRRRPDGEHVCFEVNPMPAYSYFEAEAGQPISVALVEFLAGKAA